jgi:hypothetical protein
MHKEVRTDGKRHFGTVPKRKKPSRLRREKTKAVIVTIKA